MTKFVSSITGLALGLLFLNGTIVPQKFCEGVRFDGILYPDFIGQHALTDGEAARLNDPVLREQVRRASADRWGSQVKKGQVAKCGQASF
jgi:hypothetical protein